MTTPIAAAVGAVVAALQSAPAVCAVVDRVRLRPVAAGVAQAVAVRPVQSDVAQAALSPGYPLSLRTVLAVDCYARVAPGGAPDAAVDGLVEAVMGRLMTDPSLGGAVVQLQPKSIAYDFDAHDQLSACASVVFEVVQRSSGTPAFSQPV